MVTDTALIDIDASDSDLSDSDLSEHGIIDPPALISSNKRCRITTEQDDVPINGIRTEPPETRHRKQPKRDILQAQFSRLLILQSPLRSQFQDFLRENFMFLKDMSEIQFMDFMMNQKFNGVYDDFIR